MVRRAVAAAPLALGLLALGLYRTTLLPGVGWWDTAEFQTVGPLLGTAHPTGYPSYLLLGWLASVALQPLGEPAFRMNFLSAILAALAVAGTAVVGRALTGRLAIGLLVGAGLALTPAVWEISTAADPHALQLALTVGLVALLLRWEQSVRADGPAADRWLLGAACLGGVAVGNHGLTLLLAPWLGLFVLAVEPRLLRRPRFLAACLGLTLSVAGLLYLELPLRAGPLRAPLVYGHPDRPDGFLEIVLGRQFAGAVGSPFEDVGGFAGAALTALATQFGPLSVLVPVAALATVRERPRFALLSLPATATTLVFAGVYENAAIDRYYLGPIVFGWCWLGVLGGLVVERLERLEGLEGLEDLGEPGPEPDRGLGARPGASDRASPERRHRLTRSPAHLLVTGLVALVLLGPSLLGLPTTRAAADRSGDHSAAAWLDAILTALPRDAVVVSWWSASTPLWYAQLIEGRRPDIWVVDDRTRLDLQLGEVTDVIEANLGHRPVYVIRARAEELAALAAAYVLEPLAVPAEPTLWRVVAPRAAR